MPFAEAQTYLELNSFAAHLQTVERTAEPSEALYRRCTTVILTWLFKYGDGYSVIRKDERNSCVPDFVVLKTECRPGGSLETYDFMMVEVQRPGTSWAVAMEKCSIYCKNTNNESRLVYAMVQIGMEIQFFDWKAPNLIPLSERLHIRDDVAKVNERAEHLKTHPLPFVLM